MMLKVNLNSLMWGVKIKYYFVFTSLSIIIFSLFHLLAFIDYYQLSQEGFGTYSEYHTTFWSIFVLPILYKWFMALFFVLLLICPNRLYYGTVLILMFLLIGFNLFFIIMFGDKPPGSDSDLDRFGAGKVGLKIANYGALFSYIFMVIILFKLCFCQNTEDMDEDDEDSFDNNHSFEEGDTI